MTILTFVTLDGLEAEAAVVNGRVLTLTDGYGVEFSVATRHLYIEEFWEEEAQYLVHAFHDFHTDMLWNSKVSVRHLP